MTVYFAIGKTVLDDTELQHLDFYADKVLEKVRKGSKVMVTVMGTADSNTGTRTRNAYLSEARGKYIMNLLKDKYGISPENIVMKSEIIDAKAKPELSRSAVISY